MQLSRSKLRASPPRPADKSASCLPLRVIARRRRRGAEEDSSWSGGERERERDDREAKARERDERRRMSGSARGERRSKRRRRESAGGDEEHNARSHALVCLLLAESLECGRGCTVRGWCSAHVLQLLPTLPAPLALHETQPSSSSSAAVTGRPRDRPTVRLSPQGPRTNNCRPVNSRYDTREEGAAALARYTYSSGGNWRSSRLPPRYKNEIRRCWLALASSGRGRRRPGAKKRGGAQKSWPLLRYFTPATASAPA